MYTCRECERPINQATELCPYCGADLTVPVEKEEPSRKRSPLGTVLRWGVLLAAIWGFLWFVLPERRGDTAAQAEAHAIEMLRLAQTALANYADAHGGFPPSLDQLPPESAEAVRQAAQRALGLRYDLLYTPGPAGPDGRVSSFALRARAGHYGYRNFFVDQTGVVRSTPENRAATGDDAPI
jgi:hypothetical protein